MQCAWPYHTGVQRGGGAGLRVLERSQSGPWGPRDEFAGWDPGVLRAQGRTAWGRSSAARRRRGESSSAPQGGGPLFGALITCERLPRAFCGAPEPAASALEGAAA